MYIICILPNVFEFLFRGDESLHHGAFSRLRIAHVPVKTKPNVIFLLHKE